MNTTEVGGGAFRQYVFLHKTFFGDCGTHNGTLNNHENQYCINCEKAACQHCVAEDHYNHRVLTIYRLVYSDVVTMDEIIKHMNCSGIQPYMSNGKQVLALSPLPHQGSGSARPRLACFFCARKLMDPVRFSFCSIACKYKIKTGKSTSVVRPVQPAPLNSARDIASANDIDTNTNGGGAGGDTHTNGGGAGGDTHTNGVGAGADTHTNGGGAAADTNTNSGAAGADTHTNGAGAGAGTGAGAGAGAGADTHTSGGGARVRAGYLRRSLLRRSKRKGIPKRAPFF